VKDTKAGTGQQLVLTLEVMEGPMTHRRIWDRLNIRNQNADAQRIAQRALADLCLAVGIASLHNSEDLHFKPFTGRVTIKADKTGQYGPQNAVRYRIGKAAAPAAATAQPAARSTPQQPAPALRPAARPASQPATRPAANARPWAKATA
jgi:hypothetical protein